MHCRGKHSRIEAEKAELSLVSTGLQYHKMPNRKARQSKNTRIVICPLILAGSHGPCQAMKSYFVHMPTSEPTGQISWRVPQSEQRPWWAIDSRHCGNREVTSLHGTIVPNKARHSEIPRRHAQGTVNCEGNMNCFPWGKLAIMAGLHMSRSRRPYLEPRLSAFDIHHRQRWASGVRRYWFRIESKTNATFWQKWMVPN
jgi:hypothetical protein